MAIVLRVVKEVVRTFPTASPEKVIMSIESYRKNRNKGSTDWEGRRAQFQRILSIAIKNRHR